MASGRAVVMRDERRRCGRRQRRGEALTGTMGADGRRGPRPAARRAADDAEHGADRQLAPNVEPRPQLLACPLVHADLTTASALAAAHEQRATPVVEIGLVERQCLVDTQPRSPEHDDQAAQAAPMPPVAGSAHDFDDLLHCRADPPGSAGPCLAAGDRCGTPGIVAGDRRRPAASSGNSLMTPSSGSKTSCELRGGRLIWSLSRSPPKSVASRRSENPAPHLSARELHGTREWSVTAVVHEHRSAGADCAGGRSILLRSDGPPWERS